MLKTINVLCIVSCLFVIGCGSQTDRLETSDNDGCENQPNLLQNAEFSMPGAYGAPQHWELSQHAGQAAYKLTTDNGEVHIEKYAQQHWMLLSQGLRDFNFEGENLTLSAEIKLNLQSAAEDIQSFKAGGGLSIIIRGVDPNRPGPLKVMYISSLEHEPHLGETDWSHVSVMFTVPQGALSMQVGFLHQAEGDMSIRQPRLQVCG